MGGGGKHSCLRKPSCGDTAGSTFQEHGCSLQILKRLDSHLLMIDEGGSCMLFVAFIG